LIHIDAGLRKQIDRGMSTTAMKPLLRQQGTQFMRQDGLNKVMAGLTTVEEVAFAVPLEEEESEPHAEL
jgi:type II secretory ATPase GspE/PulE/Tfp pilus assembly ATPase PilB-like protein